MRVEGYVLWLARALAAVGRGVWIGPGAHADVGIVRGSGEAAVSSTELSGIK